MKKIALTGVIGAGKSTVIQTLQEAGIIVLDADQINHELMEPGNTIYDDIIHAFGNEILDEEHRIDRKKLSDFIFANTEKKEQLEAISHPRIRDEIMRRLREHESEVMVAVEVPLLFEVNWESYFDEIWVIACDEERLLKRLIQYRGFQREDALKRLHQQMDQDEKIKRADVVLYNNGSIEDLKQQVRKRMEEIKEEAYAEGRR